MPTPPPLPPHLREAERAELQRALHGLRRMWHLALLSPLLYLMLADYARRSEWLPRIQLIEVRNLNALWLGWGGVALLGVGGVALLRRRARLLARRGEAQRAIRLFYVMCLLADALACLGLAIFLVSGAFGALLVGGVAAYLSYAIAHPPRGARLEPGPRE